MPERGELVAAFVAWSEDSGLKGPPTRSKTAKELLEIAGGDAPTEAHIDALAQRMRKRFAGPRDIIAAREIGEQLIRWWGERAGLEPPDDDFEPPAADDAVVSSDSGGDFALDDGFSFVEDDDEGIGVHVGADTEPLKGGAPTEEERGVLPPEFADAELMKAGSREAVDIDALPTSHGFRAAVVASVKPGTSSMPPASSAPPMSSAPPGSSAPPASSFPPPGVDDDEEEEEEQDGARTLVLLGVLVALVAIAAIAITLLK